MSMPHPAPTSRRRLGPGPAALLTFFAAACVLVLEIAAGRLLAPYVGVTLTTWTGIIGVILAGIAVGAWAGGRAADRVGPETLIGPVFIVGGLAAMASVPIIAVFGPASRGFDLGSVMVLSTIGFLLPATILSAVAPMIVRATIRDVESSGTIVGRLSAIGTAGALVGTFSTGFWLLGIVPTRTLILATGGLLVLIGLVTSWRLLRARGPAALAVLALVLMGAGSAAFPGPCERESPYYCISVIGDREITSGRILVLDNLWHAFVDLEDPTRLQFAYVRWFAAATEPIVRERGPDLTALHLGGGFAFPRYLGALAPGSHHRVLELDPAIVDVGRDELGLVLDERLAVRLGDARLSIEDEPTDAYDIVAGDAFGGLSVPWHLTTSEFLAEVDRVLRPEGRYVMNLIDNPKLRFVRAEVATLRARFAHVAVLGLPSVLPEGHGGNVVLVASHEPLDVPEIRARSEALGEATAAIADPEGLDSFTAGSPVLRDDYAPVDQLIWE
ncbi:MAG: spermidine synthase [Chloroflexi bacterium]|nr:spermidine synthase [Chloroflexota bacterium]